MDELALAPNAGRAPLLHLFSWPSAAPACCASTVVPVGAPPMAPNLLPMANSPSHSPPLQVLFPLPFPQIWSTAPNLLCPCRTPCLRSPDNDSLFCIAPSTRSMECRSELYPICNACAPSSKSPQPCWSATARRRSAIPSLVVDLGEPLAVPHPSIR
jgi:hypothetical protein